MCRRYVKRERGKETAQGQEGGESGNVRRWLRYVYRGNQRVAELGVDCVRNKGDGCQKGGQRGGDL